MAKNYDNPMFGTGEGSSADASGDGKNRIRKTNLDNYSVVSDAATREPELGTSDIILGGRTNPDTITGGTDIPYPSRFTRPIDTYIEQGTTDEIGYDPSNIRFEPKKRYDGELFTSLKKPLFKEETEINNLPDYTRFPWKGQSSPEDLPREQDSRLTIDPVTDKIRFDNSGIEQERITITNDSEVPFTAGHSITDRDATSGTSDGGETVGTGGLIFGDLDIRDSVIEFGTTGTDAEVTDNAGGSINYPEGALYRILRNKGFISDEKDDPYSTIYQIPEIQEKPFKKINPFIIPKNLRDTDE